MQLKSILKSSLLLALTLPLNVLGKARVSYYTEVPTFADPPSCGKEPQYIVDYYIALGKNKLDGHKDYYCGKCVKIVYNNKYLVGRITDRCPGCGDGLDISPAMFAHFEPLKVGVFQADWSIVSCDLYGKKGVCPDSSCNISGSSSSPKPTTQAPKPTTQAPKPTTQAPKPTTQAPKPTTQAPKPTTQAPKPVTQVPKPTTTQAPKPNPTQSKPVQQQPKPAPQQQPKPAQPAPQQQPKPAPQPQPQPPKQAPQAPQPQPKPDASSTQQQSSTTTAQQNTPVSTTTTVDDTTVETTTTEAVNAESTEVVETTEAAETIETTETTSSDRSVDDGNSEVSEVYKEVNNNSGNLIIPITGVLMVTGAAGAGLFYLTKSKKYETFPEALKGLRRSFTNGSSIRRSIHRTYTNRKKEILPTTQSAAVNNNNISNPQPSEIDISESHINFNH